jgi:hypothetical protein
LHQLHHHLKQRTSFTKEITSSCGLIKERISNYIAVGLGCGGAQEASRPFKSTIVLAEERAVPIVAQRKKINPAAKYLPDNQPQHYKDQTWFSPIIINAQNCGLGTENRRID